MSATPYALLAEDEPNTAQLIETILAEAKPPLRVQHVANGELALDFLHGRGAYDGLEEMTPAVVLADLEMPRMDGVELLQEIKRDKRLKFLPVVVMAGAYDEAKTRRCYELGANAVVVKPANYAKFAEFMRTLTAFWLTMNQPLHLRMPHHSP